MKRLSRASALKLAAILSFLLGLYAFVGILPYLSLGAAALEEGSGFYLLLLTFVLAILRMIAAFGVWLQQRWGIVITILVNALDAILAMPGLLYASSMEWRIAAFLGVVGGIAIIALCLWRDPPPPRSRVTPVFLHPAKREAP